jgi:hypothetical protein
LHPAGRITVHPPRSRIGAVLLAEVGGRAVMGSDSPPLSLPVRGPIGLLLSGSCPDGRVRSVLVPIIYAPHHVLTVNEGWGEMMVEHARPA